MIEKRSYFCFFIFLSLKNGCHCHDCSQGVSEQWCSARLWSGRSWVWIWSQSVSMCPGRITCNGPAFHPGGVSLNAPVWWAFLGSGDSPADFSSTSSQGGSNPSQTHPQICPWTRNLWTARVGNGWCIFQTSGLEKRSAELFYKLWASLYVPIFFHFHTQPNCCNHSQPFLVLAIC
jgi:hypothetical protein